MCAIPPWHHRFISLRPGGARYDLVVDDPT
jgi:hypothetical protein